MKNKQQLKNGLLLLLALSILAVYVYSKSQSRQIKSTDAVKNTEVNKLDTAPIIKNPSVDSATIPTPSGQVGGSIPAPKTNK